MMYVGCVVSVRHVPVGVLPVGGGCRSLLVREQGTSRRHHSEIVDNRVQRIPQQDRIACSCRRDTTRRKYIDNTYYIIIRTFAGGIPADYYLPRFQKSS